MNRDLKQQFEKSQKLPTNLYHFTLNKQKIQADSVKQRSKSYISQRDEKLFKVSQLYATPINSQKTDSKPLNSFIPNQTLISSHKDFGEGVTQLYLEGIRDLKIGKIHDAVKCFSQSLVLNSFFYPGRYMLGISFFTLNFYDKCLREIELVIHQCPNYQRNQYLIMALCYKKQNLIKQSISILEKGIKQFISYYDGMILKGKLELKLSNIQAAQISFKHAISLKPLRAQAYDCMGDCLKYERNFYEAEIMYKKAVELYQISLESKRINKIKQKLSIITFESQMYDKSYTYIDQSLNIDSTNSNALYIKGLILLKMKKFKECQLYFEEAIQNNNSQNAVNKSMIEIIKIQIYKRDFYSAYHTICRADYFNVDRIQLVSYREFTEAVLHLKKSNYIEAQQLFEKLDQKLNPQSIQLIIPPYRAFNQFQMSQYLPALNNYNLFLSVGILEYRLEEILYNKLICEGIIAMQIKEFQKSISLFDKAYQLDQRPEPLLYQSILWIQQSYHCQDTYNTDQAESYLLKSLTATTIANSIAPYTPTPLYLRAIVQGYNGQYQQAIHDINQAITFSKENILAYFYLKAVLLGCSGDINSALIEFQVCIRLDKEYPDAHLCRSKCNQILGQTNQAFQDMEKYIKLKQLVNDYNKYPEKNIHFNAAKLLLSDKAYDDAVKVYKLWKSDDQLGDRFQKGTPEMKFQFDNQIIRSLDVQYYHNQSSTVQNSIQPPWIKRNSEGVMFTDDIQQYEDLKLKTLNEMENE